LNDQGHNAPPVLVTGGTGTWSRRKLVVRVTITALALTAVVMYSQRQYLYWRQRHLNYCLICAARDGELIMVRYYLWTGQDVNERVSGCTPLMEAAGNGHIEVVDLLVRRGAGLDLVDAQGNTALMWAAMQGNDQVVQHLIAKGVSLNHQNQEGETALTYAMRNNHPSLARLLVEAGADVNLENKYGETALVRAGQRGLSDMVRFLKQHGAVKTKPFIGPSPFPTKPLPPSRLWALATTALLVQVNGDSHELLGSRPASDRVWAVNGLRNWWNIRDRRSAIKTLDWLQDQGNHEQSRGHHERSLRKRSDGVGHLAWDYCRLVWVAGVSYIAGYLTEDEAWHRIMPAARALQANYSSWREMGRDYLAGREKWNDGRDPQFAGVFQLLTDPNDPNSPWNKNKWGTDLSE